MTLQEYIEKVRKDLGKFQVYWEKNNKKSPTDFPIDVGGIGDWDEQFMMFEEDREKDKGVVEDRPCNVCDDGECSFCTRNLSYNMYSSFLQAQDATENIYFKDCEDSERNHYYTHSGLLQAQDAVKNCGAINRWVPKMLHADCKDPTCEWCAHDHCDLANYFSKYIYFSSDVNWLDQYAEWLDENRIKSIGSNGWLSQEAFDKNNIDAFITFWTRRTR